MRIVETHDPETLRLDDDSFLSRMCGFVCILVSVSVWPIMLHAEGSPGKEADLLGLVLVLGGSLLGAAFGLAMMLYSGQTIIDRRLGKVVMWTRFLWWKPKQVFPLKDFARVAVIKHSGRRGATWSVELHVKAHSQVRTVFCGLEPVQSEAAQIASRISEFSGIPLEEPLPL